MACDDDSLFIWACFDVVMERNLSLGQVKQVFPCGSQMSVEYFHDVCGQ